MVDAYWASKILVGTWRSGDPAVLTAFHSARTIWLLSRSVCGNCPAVLHLWGLAVCRCVHAGKGREPETRDTNGCCDSPLFLFCWCVTGKLRRKSSTASSGAFLSTFCCSTAVSSLWLLIFLLYCLMLPALSVILMLDAGKFEQRHALSIPAHLHLPELEFFRQFHWCSPWLGARSGTWYTSHWSLFPCPERSPRLWMRSLWFVFLLFCSLVWEVAPLLSKYLLWYLFPTWKEGGVEGNDDSIPLKHNVFRSLLLSLWVVAGHHYFWYQRKTCGCTDSWYKQKKWLEEDGSSGERLWRPEVRSFN